MEAWGSQGLLGKASRAAAQLDCGGRPRASDPGSVLTSLGVLSAAVPYSGVCGQVSIQGERRSVKRQAALAMVLSVLASAHVSAQGPRFKSYYEGLPDLDGRPPFAAPSPEQTAALRDFLLHHSGSAESCTKAIAPVGVRELCDRGADEGRTLLRSMAHGLPPGQFGRLWRTDLDGDGDVELLAQYDTTPGEPSDRYSAFFVFRWVKGAFHVTAASWFLEGSLHAVCPFGPTSTGKIFVRVLSCTGCHPWVYLVVCDLLVEPSGAAFEFQYNLEEPDSWQREIEYKLPGMGHSIDASVETRIPGSPQPGDPHLMQHFDVHGGEGEWWAFTCKGYRCGAELFKGKAPDQFILRWKQAKPL